MINQTIKQKPYRTTTTNKTTKETKPKSYQFFFITKMFQHKGANKFFLELSFTFLIIKDGISSHKIDIIFSLNSDEGFKRTQQQHNILFTSFLILIMKAEWKPERRRYNCVPYRASITSLLFKAISGIMLFATEKSLQFSNS